MAAGKRKDNKGRNLRQGESQRADGRYMYRYTDVNGSRKTIYSMDLAELRDMEKEIERNLEDGISTDAKTTLNDMYHRYMESKTELKATTKGNYQYMYEHFVMGTALGKKQVSKIKYSDVKAYYNSLVKQGLSANTIDNVHTIIHPILTLAVRDGIIRSNPSDGVMAEVKKSHGFEKTQRHALTVPQQERFLDFLNQSDMFGHWKNLITVFLGTGCRVGELIGLRWDDVDFKNNIISINHNCVYQLHGEGRSEFHITTPKTSAGCREIPMLSEVKKALQDECHIQFMTGGQNKAVVYDEQGNEFCDIYLTAAELAQVHVLGKQFFTYFFLIVDLSHSNQGKPAQVAVHQHGLCIGITYYANSAAAAKTVKFTFKLTSEIIVFKVVYAALESQIWVIGYHTGAACSKM